MNETLDDHLKVKPFYKIFSGWKTSTKGINKFDDLPENAIFAFGTEREGLSSNLADLADVALGLPMRHGVSSINLAATVGIVLYTAIMHKK